MTLAVQLEVMREVFTEWMRIHRFDHDFRFFNAEEWGNRDEQFLSRAKLIMSFDNQLVSIFNYSGQWEVEEELQELAGGFGYWFEFGNHWNIGFYELEDWPELPPLSSSYTVLLKDDRWTEKRNRITQSCNGSCENCNKVGYLEVHHCYYRWGRYPWQYPDAAFLALCRPCHQKRQDVELRFRTFLPRLKTDELETLQSVIDNNLYWLDRDRFFDFLRKLPHDNEIHVVLRRLLETKGHPEERANGSDNSA